jgi:hypothetical protein
MVTAGKYMKTLAAKELASQRTVAHFILHGGNFDQNKMIHCPHPPKSPDLTPCAFSLFATILKQQT